MKPQYPQNFVIAVHALSHLFSCMQAFPAVQYVAEKLERSLPAPEVSFDKAPDVLKVTTQDRRDQDFLQLRHVT